MAYRIEKETGDIVFDGFEKGIGSSPHAGIANIQGANISTETGEAMASFNRQQQSMTESSATGTLAFADSTHVSLSIANTNNLFKGQWITVTNSSHTGELPNGTYYVPPSTGSNFKLANYYNVSATVASATADVLVVGGGGGGGSYTGSSSSVGGGGGGAGSVKSSTGITVSQGVYPLSIGAGGAGGDASSSYQGYTGSNSSALGVSAAGGGGGGATSVSGTQTGANGGSGGGAGSRTTAGTNNGGTASDGNNGGSATETTVPTCGAGGGGASAVGQSVGNGATTGGNGGNGTASSISGASVTYGGGGGGGAAVGGSGGTGGGGAGASGTSNGTDATANTGGGGGGAFRGASGTGQVGGSGGSGIVIISMTTGIVSNPTTCGGTYTTAGGKDIWTFTTAGNAAWSPLFNTTAAPAATLSGFTAGLTATIALVNPMGRPIAKATESYLRSGTQYYRYYILDNNNIVWVYDTYNDTIYSASDNVAWFVPDYKTDWCTGATGIAVIDGMLVAAAQSGTYAKPTVQLGGTNTQNTTWAEFYLDSAWNGNASANHFCYVGHQGYLYITDGSYIRSIFPDSTLQMAVPKSGGTVTDVTTTGDNVQSMASWTANSPDFHSYSVTATASPVAGPTPFTSDQNMLPVIFFTDGNLPLSINANQVYYIDQPGATPNTFNVYSDPSLLAGQAMILTGNASAGATSATMTAEWAHPTGYYITEFITASGNEWHNVKFTNNSTTISWITPLTNGTSSTAIGADGRLDLSTGSAGNQYYATFFPTSSGAYWSGDTPLYALSTQRLTLPNFETAQCMTEIGNTVIVGCKSNTVYPWDQVSNLPGSIISLPESNTQSLLTVNQMAYIFAGNKGNVYITDGSLASLVIKVPDYCAGVPGSPATYVEPYFSWGDTMYVRGRVYFSIIDQTSTKAGNCGGVWSFIPTQNFYLGQDLGLALRLENQNSYATYNGGGLILLPRQTQGSSPVLYWCAWESDITTPTYGIDYSNTGTSASFPYVIETDVVETGTMLEKKTFEQIEFKLSAPLDTGATVVVKYRQNLTDAWRSCGPTSIDTKSRLSGYVPVSFEKGQWLQLQTTFTPITSTASTNTFVRAKEIRVR